MRSSHNQQLALFSGKQPVVVCNGIGVNSMTLLIQMRRRSWRPDLILHADPGSEFRQTYEYIPVMNRALESWGFPTITIVRYVPSNFNSSIGRRTIRSKKTASPMARCRVWRSVSKAVHRSEGRAAKEILRLVDAGHRVLAAGWTRAQADRIRCGPQGHAAMQSRRGRGRSSIRVPLSAHRGGLGSQALYRGDRERGLAGSSQIQLLLLPFDSAEGS